LEKFYQLAELLASFVVPNESGLTIKQKIQNSYLTVGPLSEVIKKDLMWWKYCDKKDFDFWRWKDYSIKPEEHMTYYWRHVRTRLYFTSSSQMYALFNILYYLGQENQIFEENAQIYE
jgi:inositol-hexakisphosphate/diphosphoinositol-pentakisphosphate 1-kinase